MRVGFLDEVLVGAVSARNTSSRFRWSELGAVFLGVGLE